MSILRPASHLISPRIGYEHHGLYVGNQQVIHLTSQNRIELVSLNSFCDGNRYQIKPYQSQFSQDEIIARAYAQLGYSDYNLAFNNCEHFVNSCIHDTPRSQQVENVSHAIALAETARTVNSLSNAVSVGAGFALLSTTPIAPAAIVGLGVFKLIQFLND